MLCEFVLCEFVLCEFVLCEFVLCEFVLCEFVLCEFVLCEFVLCEFVLCEFVLCEFVFLVIRMHKHDTLLTHHNLLNGNHQDNNMKALQLFSCQCIVFDQLSSWSTEHTNDFTSSHTRNNPLLYNKLTTAETTELQTQLHVVFIH